MSAQDKKIFVDLDRTIFETDVFVASIWHYLGKKYGVNGQVEQQRFEQFCSYDGDMRDYDFFSHLEALDIGDVPALVFELTLYLQKQFLLFNDSEEGIRTLQELGGFTILTYGNERYQRFKLACVPELARFPVEIVQQHKKHYFVERHPNEPSILIDDKDLAGSLPENVAFYRIDRTQPLPVIDQGSYVSIRKLQNIKEALKI